MTLSLGMIHSAVRITSIGELRGTGFLVTVASETLPGVRWGYVVTAHHVIDKHIEIDVQAPNPFSNGELYEPERVEDWRQPLSKVDLAIAPFPPQANRTRPIPPSGYQATRVENMIPTDIVKIPPLGGLVYYIGIFEPLMRPVARSGTIAALDQEGIPHPQYDYTAHLVDCRSYKGFSGSPCLVEFEFARLREIRPGWPPLEETDIKDPPKLGLMTYHVIPCGMFTRHYSDEGSEDAAGAVSRYGVGAMVRSNEIKEALMKDDAREERRRWDEEHAAAKAAAQAPLKDAGMAAGKEADEFDRFEDLTRKLVQVPKRELDEKRRENG